MPTADRPTSSRGGCTASFEQGGHHRPSSGVASEQSVQTERIAHPDDVAGRNVIEPEGDMEIELLSRGQAIDSAGIQQLARARMLRGIANLFHKQARLPRHPPSDYQRRFRAASSP